MRPRNYFVVLSALFYCLAGRSWAQVQQSTWMGGAGEWASKHWENIEGWPGSGDYRDVTAVIADPDAEVKISNPVTIELSLPVLLREGKILQTGGVATFDRRLDIRGTYFFQQGEIHAKGSIYLSQGGELQVEGGRIEAPDAELKFMGEVGRLVISKGEIALGHVIMNTGDFPQATVEVIGDLAELQTKTFRISTPGGGGLVKFVLSSNGVSAWKVLGGAGSLDLGEPGEQASLIVEVGQFRNDGTLGVKLFDYSPAQGALSGSFGDVQVRHHQTVLTLGREGELKAGEYYLKSDGGDGTDIVLYFNNLGQAE